MDQYYKTSVRQTRTVGVEVSEKESQRVSDVFSVIYYRFYDYAREVPDATSPIIVPSKRQGSRVCTSARSSLSLGCRDGLAGSVYGRSRWMG